MSKIFFIFCLKVYDSLYYSMDLKTIKGINHYLYDNLQEFKENYTAEEYQVDDYNKLWEYTQVIPIDKESFIIQDF